MLFYQATQNWENTALLDGFLSNMEVQQESQRNSHSVPLSFLVLLPAKDIFHQLNILIYPAPDNIKIGKCIALMGKGGIFR